MKWNKRLYCWRKVLSVVTLFFFSTSLLPPFWVFAQALPAQPELPDEASPEKPLKAVNTGKLYQFTYLDSPLDQVLDIAAEIMNRVLIKAPGINASITLNSRGKLTADEALQAIEAVLAMNNITLVPMGEKFLKVVQTGVARQEGMKLNIDMPEKPFDEDDELMSQVIVLKYVEIAEIQAVIQSLIHGYGKIQPLERTNSLLVTDTAANIKRILEILDYMDQPIEAKVETRIYELRYAEAAKVAAKLNELIADSQAKEDTPRVRGGGGENAPQTPAGVIRARRARQAEENSATSEETSESAAEMAERGVIGGKVKIIADDRTNIIFVISRPENFAFFDKIVAVLDRPIDPDIVVRVIPLEYAEAEEVAGILNEFIGAASSDKSTATSASAAAEGGADQQGSQELRQYVVRQAQERVEQVRARLQQVVEEGEGRIGRLSPNTRILADKRTNALLLMGRKGDLDALEDVLAGLDIMLGQVLIETVIIEVNLGKTFSYGFEWLQRSMTAYNEQEVGGGGGVAVRQPVFSFGGGQQFSDGEPFQDGGSITRGNVPLSAGGLTYFSTIMDLNLDVVLKLAAASRDARIVSTPVVLTTDNTEAKIVAGEERPVVTSTSTTDTGTQTQNFEYRNIGINITVTPRINPARYVVMEIAQTADNVGGFEIINGNRVPIITKRELQAEIAVDDRSTIVLGGLVSTDSTKERAKIPLLGDIPLLGIFFRSDSKSNARTELLVMLTPYVMMSPQETDAETMRLHNNSASSRTLWHRGWSDSKLSKKPSELLAMEKKKREQYTEEEINKKSEGSRITVVKPLEWEEPEAGEQTVEPASQTVKSAEEPGVKEATVTEGKKSKDEKKEDEKKAPEDLNAPVPLY